MRKLFACGGALVAALAFTVSGALGGAEQTPGLTAKKITIGATFPLTGPVAGYAPIATGIKTYFSYINARRGPDRKRGIMGRQVDFKVYDDGYNPANTVQFTRKLVEEDKVFAIVGQLGTEPVLAARPYLNQQKVPQSLVATGASNWGTEYKEYPWTIGWQVDYIAEGRLYGQHIKANHSGKKIAVLYQNDDYGKNYLLGLRSVLGKQYADANIVSQQAFEVTQPNVTSEMARIRASGATIFMIFATPPEHDPRVRDREGTRLQPRADLPELGRCHGVLAEHRGRLGGNAVRQRVALASPRARIHRTRRRPTTRPSRSTSGSWRSTHRARTRTTRCTSTGSGWRRRSCRRCTGPARTRPAPATWPRS